MDHSRARGRLVREEYSTTDPETAEEQLRRVYCFDTLRISGPTDEFTLGRSTAVAPQFVLGRLRVGVSLVAEGVTRRDDALVVARPVDGRVSYVDSNRAGVHADTGDVVLAPPGGPQRVVCDSLDLSLVQLDRPAVAAYGAAVTGIDAEDVSFEGGPPIPGKLPLWLDTVAHVRDVVLANPWAAREPIVLRQAFRSLAAALLATFPNTALAYSTDPEAPHARGEVSEAVFRTVVDFLDTHADQPIGLSDISEVSELPVNEILAGLRRRRRHPATLLWEARLRGVRRDLLEADPEAPMALAEYAARWGFAHVGRFRIAYAQTFGERPEDSWRR